MGKYASKLVATAKAWRGVKQGDSVHKYIVDLYNSHKPLARGYSLKYSDAWCAGFVSACAIKNGYTDIIPTEVSCPKMITLFQNMGCWIENENRIPNIGEIVFYDWDDNGVGDNRGSSDHVGIVVNVSRETFTVIEGNYSNMVKERILKINDKYIRGFGVPKYDVESSQPSETVSKPSEGVPNCITELAKLVIRGDFGNEPDRTPNIMKAIQSEVNRLWKG